jgi:uncharacterized protein YceH (UPF0502 family)
VRPELDPVQLRVLGSLVEKALATPQYYPLTLHALVAACNQASNRDPVVCYEEPTVLAALEALKAMGLVRFVLPSHGRSAVRYRHVLDERLGLSNEELALLALLMLRGPQTVGELRARSERLANLARLDDVTAVLRGLAVREEPLVAIAPRRPGQREERYVQLLGAAGLDLGSEGVAADRIEAPASFERGERAPEGGVAAWPGAHAARPSDAAPSGEASPATTGWLVAELSRLAWRVERLERALQDPMALAGHRSSEPGGMQAAQAAASASPDEQARTTPPATEQHVFSPDAADKQADRP